MAYSNIAVQPIHGHRARALAKHYGMSVAALVGTLIDLKYIADFGDDADEKLIVRGSATKEWRETKVLIPIQTGQNIAIASVHADSVAEMIRHVATMGGARMKLDSLTPISISRKGSGVVIEAEADNGKPAKLTLSPALASKLADRLVETVAAYAASKPK